MIKITQDFDDRWIDDRRLDWGFQFLLKTERTREENLGWAELEWARLL